jgi:hypothetical protein
MTRPLLEREQTYRFKKKKVIPVLEVSVKNRTLRAQTGGVIRTGYVRDSIRDAAASRSIIRESQTAARRASEATSRERVEAAARQRETLSERGETMPVRENPSESATALRRQEEANLEVRSKLQAVERARAALPPTRLEVVNPAGITPIVPPKPADTTQSGLALHDLTVKAAEATARFNARIAQTLASAGKEAASVEQRRVAQITQTATIQRARQELIFTLTQIKADCQVAIRGLSSDGHTAIEANRQSSGTVRQLAPTAADHIRNVNDGSSNIDKVSLQVYSTKDDLTKRIQSNSTSISDAVSKLEIFSNRVTELSNMLTRVPSAFGTSSDAIRVRTFKIAIDTFIKTAVKPSLVPVTVSHIVTSKLESLSRDMGKANGELATLHTSLTVPRSLVENLPGQKEAAKAGYRDAVDGVTSLDPTTRNSLTATTGRYEANKVTLSQLEGRLGQVKPPIINEKPAPNRDNAADAVANAVREATTTIPPDVKPQPTAPRRIEYKPEELTVPFISHLSNSVAVSRDALNSAYDTSVSNGATLNSIQLVPAPTRDAIDAATASYNSNDNKYRVLIDRTNGNTSTARLNIYTRIRSSVGGKRREANRNKIIKEALAAALRGSAPERPVLRDTSTLETSLHDMMNGLENAQEGLENTGVILNFIRGEPITDNGASLAIKALMHRLDTSNRNVIISISVIKSKTYLPSRENPRPDPTANNISFNRFKQ